VVAGLVVQAMCRVDKDSRGENKDADRNDEDELDSSHGH
jgi:hypothetical protein